MSYFQDEKEHLVNEIAILCNGAELSSELNDVVLRWIEGINVFYLDNPEEREWLSANLDALYNIIYGETDVNKIKEYKFEDALNDRTIHDPVMGGAKGGDIHDLDLLYRTKNSLFAAGITTISQLEEKTHIELLKLPQFGRVSLKDVCDGLARAGKSLRGGNADPS